MPQAAPSLGQPRPISRWGGFDRPHRAYLHTGLAYDTGMGIETGYVSPLFVKEQETSTDAWGRVPPPPPAPPFWQHPHPRLRLRLRLHLFLLRAR
jgi:hypothetical protein